MGTVTRTHLARSNLLGPPWPKAGGKFLKPALVPEVRSDQGSLAPYCLFWEANKLPWHRVHSWRNLRKNAYLMEILWSLGITVPCETQIISMFGSIFFSTVTTYSNVVFFLFSANYPAGLEQLFPKYFMLQRRHGIIILIQSQVRND